MAHKGIATKHESAKPKLAGRFQHIPQVREMLNSLPI